MLPKSPGFERIQGAMTDGRGPIAKGAAAPMLESLCLVSGGA